MKYYPIFLDVENKHIILAGGGETALAKLRLLLKTEASLDVYAETPHSHIISWAEEGQLTLHKRRIEAEDFKNALVVYAANEDSAENLRVQALAKTANVLVNVVDTPEQCDFITPAIVDRDPVVVAIGTEGAAPVVARQIKAHLEAELAPNLGGIVRMAQKLRTNVAHFSSEKRRVIWSRFFQSGKNIAFDQDAAEHLREIVENLIGSRRHGFVSFVGAGPGDPELLTLKARKALHEGDVILYDRLVDPRILELARREAILIETGKTGYGKSWKQDNINTLMIEHAERGAHVIRLKSGDPVIYGRLDEEIDALETHDIPFVVVPGVSSAHAAAASLGRSLTQRGRNSELRILTGRDIDGFAEHDWRALARPGQCAAIYMGLKLAAQIRGRLLMHGANPQTSVTAIENVSRPNEKIVASNLLNFPEALLDADLVGPVVILFGISPERKKTLELPELLEAQQ